MGLVKTADGVVYNTDGSLSVVLKDDAPFEGVKSFLIDGGGGGRPAGRLVVLDDSTVRSFANGVVISAWYKRLSTFSSSSAFRLFSCTEDGGFNIEKFPYRNLRLVINDGGSYRLAYLSNPYFLNDLKWHYVVFVYDANTKTATVYVDANISAQISLSSGLYFRSSRTYGLAIGHEYPSGYQFNGLIADFFVGRPRDKDGNLVWTQEFIRQRYEARAPFSVPPRMPIL